MKSFEQLAKTAYATYCDTIDGDLPFPTWDELIPELQDCWVAVARKMAEEIAALH